MGKVSTIEFERQFKTLYRPLCLFAMRYLERMEDAEDIVQQAFVDLWEKNNEGATIVNLKAYVYQAVRNRSLNFLQQYPQLESTEGIPDREDTTVDEEILRAERDARLWDAIDNLPAERRRIFLLSKRDGMKYQEIANELQISVKTVENQMSKALKSLRATALKIYLFFFS